MHILEIVSFLPPYGGYFAVEQALALQQAGNKVGMLYCQQLGVSIDKMYFFTARYDRWQKTITDNKGKTLEIYQANFRGLPKVVKPNQEKCCKIIGEMFDDYVEHYGRPDVLHAQAAKWAGVAAMQISERTGIPYYVTEHFSRGCYDMDFGEGWKKDIWAKSLLQETYAKASCVIPVAEELVENTACFFGSDYTYRSVSNITDVDFYSYKERAQHSDRRFRYCCLAIANKMEFYLKGYDILAQAFRDMPDCELHIAGRDTDTKRFRHLFEEYYGGPIDDSRIVLHGNLSREGVRNLLYESDALVLASRSEVQPLVVMEALSTGIPVVGTEVLPKSERISGAVLIANTDDAQSLHDKMLEVRSILPSPVFSQKIAELSSPQHVARQLMDIFTSVK